MKRSNFLKTIAFTSVSLAANPLKIFAKEGEEPSIIKPNRIKPGDTVGIIAPGSFITEDEFNETIDNLKNLGFKPYYTKNILKRHGYLAGTDKERADDIHEMFSNPNVDWIIAARGGYGCTRILPLLDYNLIKNNPKVLMGYSDITALLYAIFSRTGLVGFHGPVGISTFNDFSVEYIKKVLFQPDNGVVLESKVEDFNGERIPFTIRSGKARGRLIGGNLTLAVSLIGTKYDIDYSGKVVFLEEVGEEPYRIDRMLTQMIEAGKFENAAGIVLGKFWRCEVKKDKPEFKISLTLDEVLYDRLFQLGIPIFYGASFGHITNKFVLPFGINIEMDAQEKTITLLESAVI